MKRGVLIVNTGSPDAPTPDAVRAYLRDFLSDERICPVNPVLWKIILNAFILPKRSVASAAKYRRIWTDEGSPLTHGMAELASGLADTAGDEVVVLSAMSYGSPDIPTALKALHDAGCESLSVLPLYPQSAYSTTGAVKDRVEAALGRMEWAPFVELIGAYGEDAHYHEAIANSVRRAGFGGPKDGLLFAFHSIPMADIRAGDTYGVQARATAQAVAQVLGICEDAWRIGFQCRFDKSRAWLGPFVRESLEELDGRERLFVVAPNFSIDCLETFYDIDIELREAQAAIHPDRPFIYVPCLNASADHVALLSHLLL